MTTITKRFSFCYGHRLPEYSGKCSNFHGHNASVEVEVSGRDNDSYPGMVMDFGKLKIIVNDVIEELDHQDITDKFHGVPATAEVICEWLSIQLLKRLPEGISLQRLSVSETPDAWATWRRDR